MNIEDIRKAVETLKVTPQWHNPRAMLYKDENGCMVVIVADEGVVSVVHPIAYLEVVLDPYTGSLP
jgi:hypothetical protein